MLLMGIQDWKFFEDQLENNKDFALPSINMSKLLNIQDWKNIPPPLVNASELFLHGFVKTSNIL